MPKKITNLTEAQIARFDEWSKKWIEIGLSTEPADFDKATKAALKAYDLINVDRPKVILKAESPLQATYIGALAWLFLREYKKHFDQLNIKDSVRASVRASVRDSVRASVRDSVRASVWASVRDSVGASVWDSVRDSKFKEAADGFNNYGIDQFWCSFNAYVSFFTDVCDLELKPEIKERFSVNQDIVKSCGWTWWHENILVISDRPLHINRDAEGRLHCENGASISCRDGWSLYHWHGVSIPKEWVTGKPPTAKEALTWENIEQRRAATEIVGWNNVLKELNAKIINKDDDPEVGTLLEAEIPDSGIERFLQVKCGTGRDFVLPVPPDMKTALEANLWTYGLDPDKSFLPEVRT